MDPLLYHLEWDVLAEVLFTIIFLSFVVERALSLVFENRWWIRYFTDTGLKEAIAFIVALLAVWQLQFDALAIVLRIESPSGIGYLLTAGIVAGGSKASIKLFHDVFKAKSSTLDQVSKLRGEGKSPKEASKLATDR